MSVQRVTLVMSRAQAAGVLPPAAVLPVQDARPWPVVLLTALGAWLAAVPLLAVVGLLLGDLVRRDAGPYLAGALVLAGAIVVLRSRSVALFVEQLAVPALLVGTGAVGFGLFRDFTVQAACALLALIGLGLAASIPRPWLRVLLSAASTVFIAIALSGDPIGLLSRGDVIRFWLAWQLTGALWLAAMAVQQGLLNDGRRAGWAALLESLLAGGLLATLAALAWWSGSTFLVGGASGSVVRELTGGASALWQVRSMQLASSACALAGAWWLARSWPSARPWCAGVALVGVVLAWFMPALGAALLLLAACAVGHRWRIAAAATLSAAWIVGAFYYQLAWPLATKAVVLAAAGALLGALAWFAPRQVPPTSAREPSTAPRGVGAGIVLCIAAVLAAANIGIWRNERLIAGGQPVFIELAPVDPRSMMQGDYMQLNFRLPDGSPQGLTGASRPKVVARRQASGIATVLRMDDGRALAPGELRIELTPKDGRWVLVTDAWFFREGEAERWARAKYGEFRVDASGRALLVGLRGPQLRGL